MPNYVQTHIHSDLSLLDSCTKFQDYVQRAAELGQEALASTEHGVIYNWVEKKVACNTAGLKYIHGVECYLTEKLEHTKPDGSTFRIRDNYHTILLAKNLNGIREINSLVSISSDNAHQYYKPRISFEEFLGLSDNVITTSACLASPINKHNFDRIGQEILEECGQEAHQEHLAWYDLLCKKYSFFEVQPHYMSQDQAEFNEYLISLSKKYDKPLICGTDVHNLNNYKAECRQIFKEYKGATYADEDDFDLSYHSYDEIFDMFKRQGVLSDTQISDALVYTNVVADCVNDPNLDKSTKYPYMGEGAEDKFVKRVWSMFDDKINSGVIPMSQKAEFETRLDEEIRVFKKVNMCTFMLSMSEIIGWCKANGIAVGPSRGSCGGSCVAYVTDITDLNPVQWHTVFSRFCNENRVEIGDIDVDLFEDDRPIVYQHIIDTFGKEKTAYVLALGTIADKATIDVIGGSLAKRWEKEHFGNNNNPYSLSIIAKIKKEYDSDPETCKINHPDIFYYFDGLVGTYQSQSMHPAGMIISPITLSDNYGTLIKDDMQILCLDMDNSHDVGLAKYDILGLRNIGIIKKCTEYIGTHFPKSYEIDWNDREVWDGIKKSPIGIFQFEESFAFSLLKKFGTNSIEDMSLVTACIRPSGASYRDNLIARVQHKNPSKIIDDMLKDNLGYLVYQEDTIKFLQDICGFSGSEADTVRRAIGHKDAKKLQEAIPKILDGYCAKSDKSRDVAEQEAKEFLQIIEDSSSYQFGYNHSVGYCLLGYLCGYYRHYYPLEFLTAFFNCSKTEEDFVNGEILAGELKVRMMPPRFRYSKSEYFFDKATNSIYKGIESVKFLNSAVANELYALKDNQYNTFVDCLLDVYNKTSINARQLDILVKLDYFKEFGTQRELLQIIKIFNEFKVGEEKQAKSIKKDKYANDEILTALISRHATGLTKNGKEAKSWTITDLRGLIDECEAYLRSLRLPDLPVKDQIKNQLDFTGSISLKTGKQEDRPRIIVIDKRILKSKEDKQPWACVITGQSVGSGKRTEYTIPYKIYKKQPFKMTEESIDIIHILDWYKNKKGYFYVTKYEVEV